MKSGSKTIFAIVCLILISTFVLWPLLRPGFYTSDDGEWMVIRLSAFFQSLREGQFPVRFLGRLNDGFGYPIANFLYPGFLYLGSLIHAIGFSFTDSIKVLLVGSVLGASVVIFFWLRRYVSIFSSLVGGASFLLAPYVSFDLYKRGSVGEILAFLPASIGLYSIAYQNQILLALAVAFLIVSHNSLALIFLVIFIAYAFWEKWKRSVPAFILGIGMSCFFWLPAMLERPLVSFDRIQIANPAQYFINAQFWLLGAPGIIALLISFLNKGKGLKVLLGLLFLASIFLTFQISAQFWTGTLLSTLIQFPYRFLAPALIVGAWLVANSVEVISGLKKIILVIVYGFFWIVPLISIQKAIVFVDRPQGYYTTNEATTTVADEYMPRWVAEKPKARSATRLEFHKGGGLIQPKIISTQKIDIDAETRDESVLQLNTIYYPGWGVAIDNNLVPISYQNPQGVMRVTVPSGKHKIVAEFRETVPRFLADLVSLGSAVLLGVLLWLKKRQSQFLF